MTERRHRWRRVFFAAVIVVAVVSAGWLLLGRVFDNGLVDGPVTGASLVWHPGMNSGGPNQHTNADAAEARRLAELVNSTHNLPRGPINCPADFGSTVRVVFHRLNQQDQAVTIALSGCAGPTWPHDERRSPRRPGAPRPTGLLATASHVTRNSSTGRQDVRTCRSGRGPARA